MLPYRVIRSRRRTLSLEIRPDLTVLVRAPLGVCAQQIEDFVRQHQLWLERNLARAQARQAAHPEPDPAQREEMIARAKAILPGKVAHYAQIMGVRPTGITVTGARTRFGSCSGKNRICFSWRLMGYPEEAIDYVVVHELAHIRYKNHSPAFHAFVASVLPDHLQRRKLLRQ